MLVEDIRTFFRKLRMKTSANQSNEALGKK